VFWLAWQLAGVLIVVAVIVVVGWLGRSIITWVKDEAGLRRRPAPSDRWHPRRNSRVLAALAPPLGRFGGGFKGNPFR
jgi:hypothetical protein